MATKLDASRDPVIVTAVRTAVGRARKGSLVTYRPDEMMADVLKAVVDRTEGFDPAQIDDVLIGCAMPEGEQGMNMGRLVSLRAGYPDTVPAETINRFCSSGLQSIAHAAMSIMAGQTEVNVAGGVESMSMVPMTGNKFTPNPHLASEWPGAYLAMGLTAENVSDKYGVNRQDQDEFAYNSHMKAAQAIDAGTFADEILPLNVEIVEPGSNGSPQVKNFNFDTDELVRRETTQEALANLRPVFKDGGSVTAGNSSPLSDGAAAVLMMSRAKAEALGLTPLVRFISFGLGGVPPEIMGIGPIVAIPKALKLAGMSLEDIDLFELNEAFAAQSLAVIRELGMDPEKVNVNGGAIALGHPLGGTGAKLTTQIVHEMHRRDVQFGMVTMCIGGGMGAAGIFEKLN